MSKIVIGGALRTKGLLDYPRQGVVKAADWLFL